jgi:hypothetical protein
MSQYHKQGPQVVLRPQEWTDYHGKIPVLQTDEAAASSTAPRTSTHASDEYHLYGDKPRVSVLMELTDHLGVLHDVLKYFWKYDINVTRIESRPVASSSKWDGKAKFDFYVDFDGSLDEPAVQKLLKDLGPMTQKLLVLDEKSVHWFPRHVSVLLKVWHGKCFFPLSQPSHSYHLVCILFLARRFQSWT